jgi:hypothetical protein
VISAGTRGGRGCADVRGQVSTSSYTQPASCVYDHAYTVCMWMGSIFKTQVSTGLRSDVVCCDACCCVTMEITNLKHYFTFSASAGTTFGQNFDA